MQLLQQFILKLLAHWVSWVKHRIRVNEFPEMPVTVQDRRKGIKKLLPTVEIGIQQVKSSLLSGTLPHHHAKRFTIFLALSQMKAQDPHWNIVLYLKCQYLICSLLAFSTGQRLQLPLVCATSPSMQFLWKVKKKKTQKPRTNTTTAQSIHREQSSSLFCVSSQDSHFWTSLNMHLLSKLLWWI